MNYEFIGLFGLECLMAIIIDYFVAKKIKKERNIARWLILFTAVLGLSASVYYGTLSFVHDKNSEESSTYIAYKYLLESELSLLDKSLVKGDVNEGHEKIIELISRYKRGDYEYVFINSKKAIKNDELKTEIRDAVIDLNKLAEHHIYSSSIAIDQPHGGENVVNDEEAISNVVTSLFNDLGYSDKAVDRYETLYKLEKAVLSNGQFEIDEETVEEIAEKYNDNQDVLRMISKYYIQTNKLERAFEYAQKLVEIDSSIENYIVYTDIISQRNMFSYTEHNPDDEEVIELMEKSQELRNEAYSGILDEDHAMDLIVEAEELEQSAKNLSVRRSINYILSRKPLFHDVTGLYDIQLAKLYMAIDERETAKGYIDNIIDHHQSILKTAQIREPLFKVVDAYNQSQPGQSDPVLKSSISELVEVQSQGVVNGSSESVNSRFTEFMISTLKYKKMNMYISEIDTSEYPLIKAYANVSGKKEGVFGLANDFSKENFEIIDTQYSIEDFKMLDLDSRANVDIALVLDSSGSMEGLPLRDLKVAALSCVDKLDIWNSKMAVVEYNSDARLVVSSTNSKNKLVNGINSIVSGGGTDISSGLRSGINELSSSTSQKSIILMSDGRDENSSGQIDEVIKKAIDNKIKIFTVGLGDIDTDYLNAIAELTGGRYIHASNSIELENVYIMLQNYITNNYCFSYTVEKNPSINKRNLTIALKDYQISSSQLYQLSADDSDSVNDQKDVQIVDEDVFHVTGIQPKSLSVSDIKHGSNFTLQGVGFQEGMQIFIGDYELENVKCSDTRTATGWIDSPIPAGQYNLKVVLDNGLTEFKPKMINVFRAGKVTKVKLGDLLISADSIGQIKDGQILASGNVMIDGFLHLEEDIYIEPFNQPDDFSMGTNEIVDLGDRGQLSGKGKIYISYNQAIENGLSTANFANIIMNGKDYIVNEDEFVINVNDNKNDFDMNLHKFKFKIPFMVDVKGAEIDLKSDRLILTVAEVNPYKIIDSIKNSVLNKKFTSTNEKDTTDTSLKVEKRSEAFKFKPQNTKGSAFIALTKENIEFGFEAELDVNESLQFGKFGLDNIVLKLNSLDKNNEYWKFGGAFSFSNITKGLRGLDGYISSYYWCPDEMAVNAELAKGIPIYNILFIDKLGIKMSGLSMFLLDSPAISDSIKSILFPGDLNDVKRRDIVLAGQTHAGVNLFSSFNLDVPENMSKWGNLGEIDKGEIALNFTQENVKASADLKILNEKLANAAIQFGINGLDMNAKASTEISVYDVSVAGDLSFAFSSTWKMLTSMIEVNGSVDSGWVNYHVKGKSSVKFLAEYDGSYYCVELGQADTIKKCWYDSDGDPVIWERFHVKTIKL